MILGGRPPKRWPSHRSRACFYKGHCKGPSLLPPCEVTVRRKLAIGKSTRAPNLPVPWTAQPPELRNTFLMFIMQPPYGVLWYQPEQTKAVSYVWFGKNLLGQASTPDTWATLTPADPCIHRPLPGGSSFCLMSCSWWLCNACWMNAWLTQCLNIALCRTKGYLQTCWVEQINKCTEWYLMSLLCFGSQCSPETHVLETWPLARGTNH
jgi:hypothetical protein